MKAYEVVIDRILDLLEAGTVPWQRPWNPAVGLPRNIRGTAYRGINLLVLGCQGYESPLWLTFRQVNQVGGRVRAGERGTPVLLWKWPERIADTEDAREPRRSAPLVRYYRVWNLLQIEGVEAPALVASPIVTVRTSADSVVSVMPAPPEIRHDGGARAFYRPSTDSIHLPPREAFRDAAGYQATLFHELVHSTGHPTRLARPAVTDGALFGDHAYSEEELVAEIGAAYLCAHVGIAERTLENSAAYVASWLRVLRDDRRLLLRAAQHAQRAVDHVLGMAPADGPREGS
ncbi:MAG: zincin-like metallopeptidase domain-containing protein [Deltaproteobacteria bacterium]|nr:zincin-like metallopeptidase domain-containing protein [Deltaproteobacteria bacterium]